MVSRRDKEIYKFNPSGTRIHRIGKGELKSPESIAVDGKGNIYVVDGGRLKKIPARPPTPDNGVANGLRT